MVRRRSERSTRNNTRVWTWPCYGGDAQRWSYDPELRYFENALGTVLTATGGKDYAVNASDPTVTNQQKWGPGLW